MVRPTIKPQPTLTLACLCCCWLQGWGLAANKLIAESVRAGDAEQAKRTAILCCVVGWTCGILGGGIVLGIR